MPPNAAARAGADWDAGQERSIELETIAVDDRLGRRDGRADPGERGVVRLGMFARMAAGLFGLFAWGAESAHTVPYVPSAAAEGHAGVVRIESRSGVSGQVRVVAVDDAGQRMEAGRLTLDAGAAIEFETGAMESGDASTGLTGTGPGQGDWRLELSTELDIEARAYARSEGFVTALHDAALVTGEVELPLFHPGGEARPRSVLRLANARGEPAAVSVRGVDDAGRAAGPVTAELGPWEARGYAASELESGSAAGLTGSLGDGDGRWRLTLSADRGSAYATNLLLDGSVLSSVPGSMSRGSGGLHRVPLFPPASDGAGRRGVVRVVNRSAASAEVSIDAFDATDRAYERLELTLAGEASGQFDSSDLEQGNAEEGLEGSTGPGEGDWWLELSSESDIEVLSYVDTASGPLSALRGTAGVETDTGMRYEALLWGASGEVRLLNAGGAPAEVRLSGTDDAGSSGGAAELTLAPWSARTLTATALAEGEAGMRGALGAGSGSWRLRLEADREIDVLSLVRGSGGMLSDVSRRGRPAGAPPRTEVIDATARGRPDLWVTASASEAELSPGEAFELTAAVGNRGGDASATTLRYHRSADAAITAGDAEVGTDAVAALAAGATSAESLTLNAPTAAGAYYYGACANAVAEETNMANNCSAAVAVAVTVREPSRQPDLVVTAMLSDAALDPGESFTLSATVRNVGDSASAATFLRYYRSTDATISGADTEVGTDAVDALSASDASAESITLTAPSTAGIYYYGACVEPVDGESDTTNNCSPSIRVDVVEPGVPDLEVGMPLVDDASPEAGGSFTLSATVTNAGDGVARSTTARYYRSADATIARSDTEVGTDAVNALVASGTSAESITLTAPSTAGIYYYGACVEPVDGESDTTNNCSPSIRVDVVEPGVPDLEVGMPLVDDASPEAGGSFTLSATVTNAGDGVARSTTARYYRSADATITTSDAEAGTNMVEALAASGRSAESIKLAAPSTAGAYYYGMCVDAVPDESDTTNNCSVAVAVTVRERPPDLTVTTTLSESGLPPGDPFTLTAEVRNVGGADAAATTVRYYRSTDGMIGPSDTELGATGVPALAAGNAEAGSLELTAPASNGTYHYGACVEPVADESDATNNCSAVSLTVGRPDLAATIPGISIRHDGGMAVIVTVSNVGTAPAGQTLLTLYGSADATRSRGDFQAPSPLVVAPLEPGAERCYCWGNFLPPNLRDHWYADVGVVRHETSTDNNESAVVEAPHECPTCRHRRCIDF